LAGETTERRELVHLVRRLRSGETTDEETVELVEELKRRVPDPEVTNLMFWHQPELTDEEVVDRALAYRPIELGPLQDRGDTR